MAVQLCGHCIIQTGWIEKKGKGGKWGVGTIGYRKEGRDERGKIGMGMELCMEQVMDRNGSGGRNEVRWMYRKNLIKERKCCVVCVGAK